VSENDNCAGTTKVAVKVSASEVTT